MSDKKITWRMRGVAFDATAGHCWYCGIVMDPFRFVLDHQVPVVQGGPSTQDNLVASCSPCNTSKRGRTVEEFRAWVGDKFMVKASEAITSLQQFSPLIGQDFARSTAAAIETTIRDYQSGLGVIVFHGEEIARRRE